MRRKLKRWVRRRARARAQTRRQTRAHALRRARARAVSRARARADSRAARRVMQHIMLMLCDAVGAVTSECFSCGRTQEKPRNQVIFTNNEGFQENFRHQRSSSLKK